MIDIITLKDLEVKENPKKDKENDEDNNEGE